MIPHNESMMLHTPFHTRCAAACEVNLWEDWKGYTTPQVFTEVDMEYFAVRNSTGVFDLSPMTKYRITGPDSEAFINKLITRDIRKLAVDRVSYVLWCDGEGKVMDDGTIFRLSEDDYRLCCYTRALDWLMWTAEGFEVTVKE